jgi:hypothetical protein
MSMYVRDMAYKVRYPQRRRKSKRLFHLALVDGFRSLVATAGC